MKAKNKQREADDKAGVRLSINPPNLSVVQFKIRGSSPYMQNKFSNRAGEEMKANQEAGQQGKKGKLKKPKDFMECYRQAMHVSADGWHGIPAPAFRSAMISACRTVGFKMTIAKLSVFVLPDGFDIDDGTPLVRITKGEPEYHEAAVRNQSGVADIRARPMWREGWEAVVSVRYDADQFTVDDVANLMLRAGMQVGIGEGRPDSRKSAGLGWGMFELV